MKNFRFLGVGLASLFWFVSIAASAFTFADGDTVTIQAGSYYLGSASTVNGTAVAGSITTPAQYTLWVVSASGTNWILRNLQTGKYLLRSGNALQVSNTSTAWTIFDERFLRTGSRGITCSGTGAWSMVNNGGSNLTIEKYHKAKQTTVERSLVLSPLSMTFPMSASSQEFTPTASTITTERFYYTCGTPATDIEIASTPTAVPDTTLTVNYELTSENTGFSLSNLVSNKATVNVTQNNTSTNKFATLTATTIFPDGVEVITQAAITQSGAPFIHQKGASNRSLQANGMQGVHTLEEVVYVKAGTSRVYLP